MIMSLDFIILLFLLIKIKYKIMWSCVSFKYKRLKIVLHNNINYILKS
jgi:hypothetical protein